MLPVLLVTKVLLVVQDLQAPEDLLGPVDPLEKMEQVDTQVLLDHQGLAVTEVKEVLRVPQATQECLALLDLLVPLVHAAVVEVLPYSVLVKNLLHTTEMSLWT